MILSPIRQYLRIAAVLGVVAVVGFLGTKIYQAGASAEKTRIEAERQAVQADLIEAGEKLAKRAAQLAEDSASLDRRAQEIEDEARQDFDPCRVPSDDSLQRLDRRWTAP